MPTAPASSEQLISCLAAQSAQILVVVDYSPVPALQEGILVHGPGCEAAQLNPRLAMATHISGSLKDWVAAQIRGKSGERLNELRCCMHFD